MINLIKKDIDKRIANLLKNAPARKYGKELPA